ncbi:MAG: hypothetical protein ACE5K3_00555 [bacterium]
MQTSSVKIGWKVMLGTGIYVVVIGLLLIFLTKILFAPDFTSFTAQSWSDFLAASPKPAELFLIMGRHDGAMVLVVGLFVVLMSWKSYRKAEKWAWYTLLITGVIGWGSGISYYIVVGDPIGRVMTIAGAVAFIIAIAFPAKAILGKKAAGK